jgi:hypothetical protein
MDAGMIGNTLGPAEAYRFARGETVTTSSGQRIRAIRPLDFLVVADHAGNLGLPLLLAEADPALIGVEWTSSGTLEDPGNLHRVVIFRDDGDRQARSFHSPPSTVMIPKI